MAKRKRVDPTTGLQEPYTEEQAAFLRAMEAYKKCFGRPFPTWSEALDVLHALGYRQVAEATAIEAIPDRRKVPEYDAAGHESKREFEVIGNGRAEIVRPVRKVKASDLRRAEQ